jgi:carbon monoxide dehydrogenase subunit G
MFVAHEVVLPVDFTVAKDRLANVLQGQTLVLAARESYDHGVFLMLRVGPRGPVPGASRLVEVQFRDLVTHGASAVLTLRWEATGPGGALFPALDADLTLTPKGPGATRLRLDGSYRPPLGSLGERLDRMILHRVAAATIDSFVARIAEAIGAGGADCADVPSAIGAELPATDYFSRKASSVSHRQRGRAVVRSDVEQISRRGSRPAALHPGEARAAPRRHS